MSSEHGPPADPEPEHDPHQTAPLLVAEVSDNSEQAPTPHEKHNAISHTVAQQQQQQQQQQLTGSEWSSGILKRFPYLGILSLIACVLCIAASVAILVASDGQPIAEWTVTPAVYLAILTTAVNTLAQFAFTEGVKITWWSAAVRGTTVLDLHRYWASGDSVLSALRIDRGVNVVSIASLAATLIAIDQPLIQRASSVAPRNPSSQVSITAPIAPEIPYGYTGYQFSRANPNIDAISMTLPMISAFGEYNSKTPITHNFTGCAGNDTCTGIVRAGGFTADCSTNSSAFDPSSIEAVTGSVSPFNVTWIIVLNERVGTNISFVVNYAEATNCSASTMTTRNCLLQSSTLEYPVQVQGNTLTFTTAIDNLTVVSIQPPTSDFQFGSAPDSGLLGFGWTTTGFGIAAKAIFTSAAMYTFAGGSAGQINLNMPDVISNQFVDISSANSHGCTTWTDPTSYILSAMNDMAFRVSLSATTYPYRNTTSPPQPQNLTMTQTYSVNVFHSDYRYLIANTVLSLVFVLLIAPTFYGWWLLGREVSLNPIETAKAFDAPLLRGPGSNLPQEELVEITGMHRVKLGEVDDVDGDGVARSQLRFMDPSESPGPRPGVLYQ